MVLPEQAAGQTGLIVGIETGPVQKKTVGEMRIAATRQVRAATAEVFPEPPDPVVDETVGSIRKPLASIPRIYVIDPAALKLKMGSGPLPAEDSPAAVSSHVRALDHHARQLLERAVSRSPTVARIVGELERTDVLVWVEMCPPLSGRTGELLLVGTSLKWRYVRIRINRQNLSDELIACLGHELQHALEIASAPRVRDQIALRQLYERIGWAGSAGEPFDSQAARDVRTRVLAELAEHEARKKHGPPATPW
jgi:hypothetical protein